MDYFAWALFGLFAICLSLRVAMIWTMRHEKSMQRTTLRETPEQRKSRYEEWKRKMARYEKWKQRIVVAAILFFALGVAVLIWPLVIKK